LTRLANDYDQIRARFDGHPAIRVDALGTVPPERYRVTYYVPSLRLDQNSRPIISETTVVDFDLPMGYPKEKPHAVAHGNVFHPNFGEYVCIADFWSPAQSLADIVLEVGQMLQWQKYNIQSPLNAIAADWAVKHQAELPVGHKDLQGATAVLDISIKNIVREEEN
jgi:hypothetical protein